MGELIALKPNTALLNTELGQRMMQDTKRLAGGSSRRISIRGGRFRLMVGGEQVGRAKSDPLRAIIVRTSGYNRTYYEGVYDPDKSTPPRCWSEDEKAPSPDVPKAQRMSATCATCKMNVKGSGQGNSRACRYSVRMAIMLDGDAEHTIYQMQVPATSIFGKREGANMGLQAYIAYLTETKNFLGSVLTEIEFDEDSETPKLFFRPLRLLDAEEIGVVSEAYDGAEVEHAIAMPTFSTSDSVEIAIEDADGDVDDEDEAPPKRRPAAKTAAPVEDDADDAADDVDAEDDADEEEEPPKRRASAKKKAKPVDDDEDGDEKLASAIAGW